MSRATACRSYIELRYRLIFDAIDHQRPPPSLVQAALWRRRAKNAQKVQARGQNRGVHSHGGNRELDGTNGRRMPISDDESSASRPVSVDLRLHRTSSAIVHRKTRPNEWEVYPDELADFVSACANLEPAMETFSPQSPVFDATPAVNADHRPPRVPWSDTRSVASAGSLPPSPRARRGQLSESPRDSHPTRHTIADRLRMLTPSSDRIGGGVGSDVEGWMPRRPATFRSSDSVTDFRSPDASDVDQMSTRRRREPASDAESSFAQRRWVRRPETDGNKSTDAEEASLWGDTFGMRVPRHHKMHPEPAITSERADSVPPERGHHLDDGQPEDTTPLHVVDFAEGEQLHMQG